MSVSCSVRLNGWGIARTYGDVIEVVPRARVNVSTGSFCPRPSGGGRRTALDLVVEPSGAETAGLGPWDTSASRCRSRRPRGLINVEEICAASPRLEAVVFGPADFAASIEMPVLTGGVQIDRYPGDHFHYVFSKILMAGRGEWDPGHRRSLP